MKHERKKEIVLLRSYIGELAKANGLDIGLDGDRSSRGETKIKVKLEIDFGNRKKANGPRDSSISE